MDQLHSAADEPLPARLLDRLCLWTRARRYPGHLVRVGERIGAELLHAHFAPWGWHVRGAARKLGVPLVVSFYGYDVNQLPTVEPRWRERYRELFADAALVLCEGEHMAACIRALGCEPAKLRVQRLGVDVAAIEHRPRAIDPRTPLRVLMAAAFREKKGVPLGIEALATLARSHPVELTLIGAASDLDASRTEGQLVEAALERASRVKGFRVRRLGFQPHTVLFDEATRHDLFLSPSLTASDGDTEGGAPMALVDMAASGIPIVSSTHCDIPGVIRHGVTGLLAREADLEDLVATLERALQLGSTWFDMTVAGRSHIEQNFDAAEQGLRLAALYREAIARAASPIAEVRVPVGPGRAQRGGVA